MSLADEVASLSERLRAVEDTLAIMTLVATFGPSVDSDARKSASHLWTRDGVYDLDVGEWRGHAEIEAMLAGSAHQDLLAAGCAHQVSAPRIELKGDTATAVCYQQLVRAQDGRYEIHRMTASHWEFVRTADGWRVARRTNRSLDGRPAARALLQPSPTSAPSG